MYLSESNILKLSNYSRREMIKRTFAAVATFMSLNFSNLNARNIKRLSDNIFGNFDFGLDEAQEKRALRLHYNSIVIDMVQQGIGGYRIFEEQHLKSLQKSNNNYMSLDAIYSEDIAGRNNIMRERWDNSGITVG